MFHFNDRPGDDHVRIVISDPTFDEVVIVGLTTLRKRSDRSCLFQKGDHEFIEHETCVAYEYAEVIHVEELRKRLQDGQARERQPATRHMLGKIWYGAASTNRMPLKCLKILQEQSRI